MPKSQDKLVTLPADLAEGLRKCAFDEHQPQVAVIRNALREDLIKKGYIQRPEPEAADHGS